MADVDEPAAEVIRLFPDADKHDHGQPATREPTKHCAHRRASLNKTARRVRCLDCEREVDAFDVLDRLAGEWDRVVRWRQEADRRSRAAQARLDELLRLERNARARLKRVDPAAESASTHPEWGEASIV